jgi:response regulator NasT
VLHTLLFITEKNEYSATQTIPDHTLSELGYRMLYYINKDELPQLMEQAEGVLLQVGNDQLNKWVSRLRSVRDLPFIWWNEEANFSLPGCKIEDELDGILYPTLDANQLHWSLFLSVRNYHQRTGWSQERNQLLARLEERKWIDQAKAILCEIKQINEEEAYQFLRKQAMNERKRMADVAASIVKVYKLIRD